MNAEDKQKVLATLEDPKVLGDLVDAAFNSADTNKNGTIERSELAAVLKDIAKGFGLTAPSEKQIDEKFKALDTDQNGTICKKEFTVFVKETTRKIIESS